MCWSIGASAAFTAAGLGSSGYLAAKKDDKALWIPLAYFSLMELLQAVSYFFIDMCGSRVNHILTILGYLHISFQPFFINAVMMYFIPKTTSRKIAPWVYTLCFAGTVVFLLKLYPFQAVTGVGELCSSPIDAMCAAQLCTTSGSWHLAWNIPLNDIPIAVSYSAYFLPAFVLPFLYGSWKIAGSHLLLGPILAILLTNNINEYPSVWCLFSVGLILIAIFTRIRKWLQVKKWYFWKYPKWLS